MTFILIPVGISPHWTLRQPVKRRAGMFPHHRAGYAYDGRLMSGDQPRETKLFKLRIAALCIAVTCATAAQAEDFSAVTEAAKKEGTLIVYNAGLGVPLYQKVAAQFEKTYGIKVESITARGSEMTERIRSEQAAGRFGGDVQMHAASVIAQQQTISDYVQPHGDIPNAADLRAPFVASDIQIPGYVQAYGILENTNLVKPGEEPKAWTDLLDPKWKGKILSDDLRPIGAGQGLFTAMQKAYGRQFHEKLATQGLVFSRDPGNDARRIARGEYPLYIPLVYALAYDLKGLPVKALIPTDGVPYTTIDLAILKNAPHKNAARLFINYFLSPEAQLVYANAWMPPVTKTAAARANDDAKPYANAKLMSTTQWQERNAMMKLANEIYK
jgi:iron(III) transport system substrate-binding protein